MPAEIHECGCGPCTRDEAHPGREYHRHMNLLLSRLDEQQRRWYLAVESERFGYGAGILFEITGVDEKTIRRGSPGPRCAGFVRGSATNLAARGPRPVPRNGRRAAAVRCRGEGSVGEYQAARRLRGSSAATRPSVPCELATTSL